MVNIAAWSDPLNQSNQHPRSVAPYGKPSRGASGRALGDHVVLDSVVILSYVRATDHGPRTSTRREPPDRRALAPPDPPDPAQARLPAGKDRASIGERRRR